MPRVTETIDFLAIGDTMLDVFVQIQEATVHCKVDKSACQISFPFGEKVPVESVIKFPGAGNASNAAVAASRLGLRSKIYSVLGDDVEAKFIRNYWTKQGVGYNHVTTARHQETNYSTVLNFQGERTILVYHHPYSYAFPHKLPLVKRIYYTSLGKEHLDLEKGIVAYLDQHPKTRLTFQPGTHQLRRLAQGTKEILGKTDILIMNKEEAALFLKISAKESIAKQLKQLQSFGPKISVITDGEKGSHAIHGTHMWSCAAFPMKSFERTGAGDAYSTAFTWAIDKGFSVPEAMRYGTANSTSVIQYLGPHRGLLDREGLNQILRKNSKIRPKSLSL